MKFFLVIFSVLVCHLSFANEKIQVIDITVTENGFVPSEIKVKPGVDVELKITRKTNSTCAREIQIPAKKIKKDLPLNKTVSIPIGKLEKGKISFGCAMDMMVKGVIFVN